MRGNGCLGWDYSISLTHDGWKKPVLEQLEGLPDSAWTDIGMEEEAIFATHHPSGWDRVQHYAVIRRRTRNGQFLLVAQHTVILVSRNDLPLLVESTNAHSSVQESASVSPFHQNQTFPLFFENGLMTDMEVPGEQFA